MDGSSVPHIESEKRFGKQSRDRGKPPLQRAELAFLAITDLKPDPHNPRKHDRAQIRAIARSIEAFGFNAPILIDKHKQIIAGHGRLEAAKLNGCTYAPVICLEHLTEAQARAYMLADNKLTDRFVGRRRVGRAPEGTVRTCSRF
jgi:ParB/RepB/Spo0J family partition protein